ncbi:MULTISPECIES: substrate-binding periplasmic protein [unclassified Pseudomonas]|uniref:substrate-binding periplasmic protein n=1 Tax=unclassified Pseudomonas TaxID=196821 RepID=UPI00235F678D|nr:MULTISPECIES: transporter substrate-binding domain-containing protein [unclassified Pseudomonas]
MTSSFLHWLILGLVLVCTGVRAGALQLVTEDYPPFSVVQPDGRVTGFSVELVRLLLARAELAAEPQVMPWARAFAQAQGRPDVLVFSMARLPEREALFEWVVPLTETTLCLFSWRDRVCPLASLQAARGLQIATVNGDAGERILLEQGFTVGRELQSGTHYSLNLEKLKAGRVDLWIANRAVADHLARQAGYDPQGDLRQAYCAPPYPLYLAASLGTAPEVMARLRAAFVTLQQDGTLAELQRRWL